MKVRKKAYYSAGLMLFAFIGMVAVQHYWINKVFESAKVSFNYQVTGAMLEVVRSIEYKELVAEYTAFDTDNEVMMEPPARIKLDAYNYSHDQLTTNDDYYSEKQNMTGNIIRNLHNKNKNRLIEERIDQYVLDSLIRNNLIRRNIKSDYEYAIYHPVRDTLVFPHYTKSDKDTFFKNASSFKLFPTDKMKYPAYLLIYFPHSEMEIAKEIIPVFFISIILLLSIVVAYVMIVKNLERQKMLYEFENEFINNMTHEFKTPIATIAIASELLSDPDIAKDEKFCEQHLRTIREENRRLSEMSEKILATARVSKGRLVLQKENVDIHDVIIDLAEAIKIRTEINDGEVILDLEAEECNIYVDRMHISNVISNLLDNAVKYSPKQPTIKISTVSSNKMLKISVTDNGIGIDKSEHKMIFQRLYRIPAGDIHNFKGYGLGLNYVKSIMDAHHGTIEVESERGKGSTFTLILPINKK